MTASASITYTRQDLPEALAAMPVVVVLRAAQAADYDRVIDALAAEGIRSVEITMTTPGTIDRLPKLRADSPPDLDIGVGSITTPEEVDSALDAGANYLVTPTTTTAVLNQARRRNARIFSGGLTPTELHLGWTQGATAVKLFPATSVGSSYIPQLRGPFPDMRIVPSGGITIADSALWLRAGASAVSIGGPLIGDAFTHGDIQGLRHRTRQLMNIVDTWRQSR
jgi:2-dehydro-3-deoxyphosphogluconate aldolase/(4S)-4-hydroxy-2-oxoglutarate aldolase